MIVRQCSFVLFGFLVVSPSASFSSSSANPHRDAFKEVDDLVLLQTKVRTKPRSSVTTRAQIEADFDSYLEQVKDWHDKMEGNETAKKLWDTTNENAGVEKFVELFQNILPNDGSKKDFDMLDVMQAMN